MKRTILLVFCICIIVVPMTVYSQRGRNIRNTQKVPVTIPFFDTKQKSQRVQSLNQWVNYANQLRNMRGFRDLYVAAFRDSKFKIYFGKSYNSLTKKDKKDILKVLKPKNISKQYMITFLEPAFYTSKKDTKSAAFISLWNKIDTVITYESRMGTHDLLEKNPSLRSENGNKIPTELLGTWIGHEGLDTYAIRINRKQCVLYSTNGSKSYSKFTIWTDGDGSGNEFRFHPIEGPINNLFRQTIPLLMAGKFNLTPSRLGLDLALPTSDGQWRKVTTLVSAEKTHKFGGRISFRKVIAYSDVFHRTQDRTILAKASMLLNEDVKRLRKKCISQHTFLLSPGETHTLNLDGVTTSTNLIYAPTGAPNLIMDLKSATSYSSGFNFPVVATRPRASLQFSLIEGEDTSSTQVPITVYTFGNSFGDYGTGCELEDTSPMKNILLLGKIILIYLSEQERRQAISRDAMATQYLALLLRDSLIQSTIHDLFPRVEPSTTKYINRMIGTVLANGISVSKLGLAATREAMIQDFERQNMNNSQALRLFDLLLDLERYKPNE